MAISNKRWGNFYLVLITNNKTYNIIVYCLSFFYNFNKCRNKLVVDNCY